MQQARHLNVVVVDDEAPARRKLVRLLQQDPDCLVVAEAEGANAAVAAIQKHKPDLVFLDVQMPGTDGFGMLSSIAPEDMPKIVFVTAHDRYAVKAFEVHAFDYLLKPFAEQRFREVLRRAREQQTESGGATVSRLLELIQQLRRERSFCDRLLVQENQRAYFVPVGDIVWIEAERNYLLIHCGTKTHTLRGTLEAIEVTLDPKIFVRVNRSSLVRLDAIRELRAWFHGEYKIVLNDSTELRWSRRYVGQYPDLLKKRA